MAAVMVRNSLKGISSTSPFLQECSWLRFNDGKSGIFLILRRMAGHSHWQNIKFKKSHSDIARSKIFGRLSTEIISAVREGGSELNPRLDNVVARAKAASMPKSSIESAIKSAQGNKDNPLSQILLEARGPGACGLLIDVLTTNEVKAKIDINTILKRNGGVMNERGSVQFQYESKGVVTIEDFLHSAKSHSENIPVVPVQSNVEKAEEIAIETGAENVYFTQLEDDKRVIKFICQFKEMKKLSEDILSFESKAIIYSIGIEYFPKTLAELTENQMQEANRLIGLILNNADVIKVYDNIKDYPSSTCKLFTDELAM